MSSLAETFLRIPKARVGVLVGTSGKTKAKLEEETNCQLKVDKEGGVELKCEDPLDLFVGRNVVTAIGRGFSTESALMLLDETFLLEIINLQDVLGKSPKALARYKARIIGTEGKAKKKIEQLTDTEIAVYGKTVSIIGQQRGLRAARKAIEMILSGAQHSTVFAAVARQMKK